MRTIRHIATGLVALVVSGVSAMAQDTVDPLRPLGVQARPLIVFAPTAEDARLAEQRSMIEKSYTKFAERDQVLISVGGDAATVLGPPRLAALLPETMDAAATAALRERFNVAEGDFAVVLIGKDGAEKMRETAPLDTGKLFETIDAMPMRQREIIEPKT